MAVPKYDSNKHTARLKDKGLWDEFQILVAQQAAASPGQKPFQHKNTAFSLIYDKLLSAESMGARAPADGPSGQIDSADQGLLRAKLLDNKDVPFDQCVKWAMQSYGLAKAGLTIDPSTAPNAEAMALFGLAERDPEKLLGPYLKKSAERAGQFDIEGEDGGDMRVLDTILQWFAEGRPGEPTIEEVPADGGDAAHPSGSVPPA